MSLADEVISAAPGTVTEYAGINLPAGYLWANGQAVSRAAYSRLFAALSISVIGTTASGSTSISAVSQDLTQLPTSLVGAPISGPGIPAGATILAVTANSLTLSAAPTANQAGVALVIAPHGIGDGSTTFNVPDRRGRSGVGHDKMGAASAAGRLTSVGSGLNGALLGAYGGAETYSLTTAQMPTHTHANTLTDNGHTHVNTISDPGHVHGNSLNDPSHAHGVSGGVYGSASLPYNYYGNGGQGGPGTPIGINGAYTGVTINNANTKAGVTLANASQTTGVAITNASQGNGAAHPNVQPSIVMNYIIKA